MDGTNATATEAAKAGGQGMGGYKEAAKRLAHGILDPVVLRLADAGIRADHLTVFGLVLSICSGLSFAVGNFRTGATFALASGLCDILDGQVARQTKSVSKFGAFFDSTLDRIAEAAILLGIGWFYLFNLVDLALNPPRVLQQLQRGLEPVTWALIALLAMLALTGSFMVSYTRARAEGLGLECKVGWFERPERLVLLILAGFAGLGPVMPAALLMLSALSFATAFQRMAYVWKSTRAAGSDHLED